MPHNRTFQPAKRHIVTAIALAVLLPLTLTGDAFWRLAFAWPTARLAATFLNTACLATPEGFLLPHPGLAVHVTQACSGATFFALLLSLLLGCQVGAQRRLLWGGIARSLATAYGVTLAANATRVVLGWVAGRVVRAHLSSGFQASAHMGVGLVVFLAFLVFTYGLTQWRLNHADKDAPPPPAA